MVRRPVRRVVQNIKVDKLGGQVKNEKNECTQDRTGWILEGILQNIEWVGNGLE